MLILDTHSEVFVWIGHSVESKEKQLAFDIGQKYIDLAVCLEGLASDVPLYKVTEGNEPCFFTAYFSWDGTKAAVHGNSFEKKLALLFGAVFHVSEPNEKPSNTNRSGPTQRASALAALSSAFNPSSGPKPSTGPKPIRSNKGSSQRATAVAALSSVLTAEQKKTQSEGSPIRFSRTSSPDSTDSESFKTETASYEAVDHPFEVSTAKEEIDGDATESDSNGAYMETNQDSNEENNNGEKTFSYERLRSKSTKQVTGIDYKRREAYLSDEEFRTVLGMEKEAFYQQPKWKQDMQKRKVDLF